MKKFFLVLGLVILFTSAVQAQDTTVKEGERKDSIQQQGRMHQEEYLLFEGGKLYWMQKGVRFEVKNQIILNNGTVLNPNGSYHIKVHDNFQLANGECFDLSGNRYRNEEMFNQKRMIKKADIEDSREAQ